MIEGRERAFEALLIAFFAAFGGATRIALSPPRERGIGAVMISLMVAAFAGLVAWQILEACGYSQQMQAAGSGMAGLLGDDILRGIMTLAKHFREDPLALLDHWRKERRK